MRNLTKKGFLNKLIIVFLVIIVFNAVIPMNKSQASNYTVGGVLLKPINSLVLKLADGVVDFIHKVIFGSSTALLEYDINNNWKILVIVGAVIIGILVAVAVATIMPIAAASLGSFAEAFGLSTVASLITTKVAIGTILKIGTGAAIAAMYLGTSWFGDTAVFPLYKISPQEIFEGKIEFLNANFFNSSSSDNTNVEENEIGQLSNLQLVDGYSSDPVVWYGDENEANITANIVSKMGEYGYTGTADSLSITYRGAPQSGRTSDIAQWRGNDNKSYLARLTIYGGNGNSSYAANNDATFHVSLEIYTGDEERAVQAEPIVNSLKPTIAKWYYTLRNIAIVCMLLELVYIGIRIMLCSIASEKAKYKNMLKDWIVAICLIFIMQYIMAFANSLVDEFVKLVNSIGEEKGYTVYIKDESGDLEEKLRDSLTIADNPTPTITRATDDNSVIVWDAGNLMGLARVQAQLQGDEVPGVWYIGYTIAFVVLVMYTVFFLFTYLRRIVYLAFLTLIAPMVAFTYPIDKVNDGKAQAFDMWLKEYIFNLLIQPFHLILYTVLISSAFELASENILYTLVAIGFLMPAEKLLRKFFGFEKAQTPGMLGGAVGASLVMNGMNRLLHGKPPRPPKAGEESGGKIKESENFGDLTSGEGIDNSLLFDTPSTSGDSDNSGSGTFMNLGNNMPNNAANSQADNQEGNPRRLIMPGDVSPEEQERRRRAAEILRQTAANNANSSSAPKTSNSQPKPQNNQTTGRKINTNKALRKETRAEKFWREHPKLKRNLRGAKGVVKSYAGQQFKRTAKGAGKLVRKMPKMAAGVALGAAAGMVGVAAGVASGDISKAVQYGGAAVAGGYSLGGSLEDFAAGVVNVNDNELQNAYERSYYGSTEEYRQAKVEERRQKYLKDDRHVAEVQHYTGEDEKYAKMLLEENSDCIDAGITDVKDILAVDHMVEEEGWSREKAMTATKMLSRESKPIEDMNQEELSHFEFRAKNAIREQGVTGETNVDRAYQQMRDNLIKVSKAKKSVTKVKRLTSDEITQKEKRRDERIRKYNQNKEQQAELKKEEKKRKEESKRRRNQEDNSEIDTPIKFNI